MEFLMGIKLKFRTMTETENKLNNIFSNKNIIFKYEKDIPYGKQFILEVGKTISKLRIYDAKKGISADLSLIKDNILKNDISDILSEAQNISAIIKSFKDKNIIGSDESGKGDYLGPLVVASVYANEKQQKILKEFSIKDSKKITDKKIKELAKIIRESCVHSIVMIYPEKYNSLYDSFNNLNSLLSWAHAKAISNVCEKVKCRDILIDRFSKTDEIVRYLTKNIGSVNVKSEVRAEENIVVAAASIIARDAFCYGMEKLEREYSIKLSKGANAKVEKIAKDFFNKNGINGLSKIAKIHFKTTSKIVGNI